MEEQRQRLHLDADRVVLELAKVAFSNIRDFLPREGGEFDLRRIDVDRTAAIKRPGSGYSCLYPILQICANTGGSAAAASSQRAYAFYAISQTPLSFLITTFAQLH